MPQDFTVDANDQQIDPDYLTGIKALAKQRGEVLPYEMTTVYATEKLINAKTIPEISKIGQPLRVHVAQAAKFIESGKATSDDPNKTDSKKAK